MPFLYITLALACATLADGVAFSHKGTSELAQPISTPIATLGQPVSTNPVMHPYNASREASVDNLEDADSAARKVHEEEMEEDGTYKDGVDSVVLFGKRIEEAVGFRIDWILLKFIIGLFLMLPAVPSALIWEAKGNPPHPFVLGEEAVPQWSRWQFDIAQLMALIGVDLIFLAGIEYNWHVAMTIYRVFLAARSMQGFCVFLSGMLREQSSYAKRSEDYVRGEMVNVQAENRFQDLTTSVVHLGVLILAQMIFMKFYSREMFRQTPFTARAYVYWLCAIPMQVIARSLMGRSFCHECTFWHTMLHSNSTHRVILDESQEIVKVGYKNLVCRALMSFYVNNASMAWIAYSLPVFCMAAPTDIDFVKDCFAITFITTLDDLPDTISMSVEHTRRDSLLPS